MRRRDLILGTAAIAAIPPSRPEGKEVASPQHLIGTALSSEAAFESRYPRAYAVWKHWLRRGEGGRIVERRSKPGGSLDMTANPSDWQNLTLDWCTLQEALEVGGAVVISSGVHYVSDTLLVRSSGTTVQCFGTLMLTRGSSRGNVVAIGEGDSISWMGGLIDVAAGVGDNGLTVFQNQLTSAEAGWESRNASRIIVHDVRVQNARRTSARYGGGKGITIQMGVREATVSSCQIVDCDIGYSVEGKSSSVPIAGPTPRQPYLARGILLSAISVRNARLAGAVYLTAGENITDPSVFSVNASGIALSECAVDNPDWGAITCDRSVAVSHQGTVTSGVGAVTVLRGTPVNCRFTLLANVGSAGTIVDTRYVPGFGSNRAAFRGCVVDVVEMAGANGHGGGTPIVLASANTLRSNPPPSSSLLHLTTSGFGSREKMTGRFDPSFRVEWTQLDAGVN